ncbi:hypothetical protein P879_04500 [Paragonimus westermani]|uniref:PHD-type domain-containing protein n=1 Tax=Paragonimus westermani TaxID=34504 RepID=A0A8T0D4J9_9TREM|nr:hypothetical protein P879_04500 [Paragonimus westermani]
MKSPKGICELHNPDVTQERHGTLIYKRLRRPSKVIPICGLCLGTPKRNEHTGLPEDLIACWACGQSGHPTCLKMPPELVARIRLLRWHCVDCKCCCLCQTNSRPQSGCNGSDLLLCDSCDRGFHMSCLEPKMTELPEGTWICPICTPRTVKTEESNSLSDPRLDAISSRDQLTQQEIDWMHQVLNLLGHASPNGRCPSSVDSSRRSTECGTSRLSTNLPSDPQPSFFKASSSTSVKSSTGHSNSVKLSKRLVQKSLTTWAIPKSCASPNKTPPKFKQKILDTTASLSPVGKPLVIASHQFTCLNL